MELKLLKQYSEQGLSHYQIAKSEGVSPSTVAYWLKKFGLKTYGKAGHYNKDGKPRIKSRDWIAIQKYYDEGHSGNETCAFFKIGLTSWFRSCKEGKIIRRSNEEAYKLAADGAIGRKHTSQTKKHLSVVRKNYLAKTNQSAWKTMDKHKSIPCEKFREHLTNLGIIFEKEWMPLQHKGRFFRIDVSFPSIKFGIEINGGQHYDTNSQLKPYYQNRHDLIVAEGWELLEIPYNHEFNEKRRDELVEIIRSKLVPLLGFEPSHVSNLENSGL